MSVVPVATASVRSFEIPAGTGFDRLLVAFGSSAPFPSREEHPVAWVTVAVSGSMPLKEFFASCQLYTKRDGVTSELTQIGDLILRSEYSTDESVLIGIERPSLCELSIRSAMGPPCDVEFDLKLSGHLIKPESELKRAARDVLRLLKTRVNFAVPDNYPLLGAAAELDRILDGKPVLECPSCLARQPVPIVRVGVAVGPKIGWNCLGCDWIWAEGDPPHRTARSR